MTNGGGVVELELTAGPDSGRRVSLRPGRHIVGRARCALRVADPAVEAHHVLLAVGDDGVIDVTQLAGRTALAIDGDRARSGRLRGVIELGDSRLERVAARRGERSGSVTLGVALRPLPIRAERHDGAGVVVPSGWLARAVLGVIDDDPTLERAHAVARSLTAGLVEAGGERHRARMVLAVPDDPALQSCTALLEIGARWRGRWTPDVERPSESVRLHVAGMTAATAAALSRGTGRPGAPR